MYVNASFNIAHIIHNLTVTGQYLVISPDEDNFSNDNNHNHTKSPPIKCSVLW